MIDQTTSDLVNYYRTQAAQSGGLAPSVIHTESQDPALHIAGAFSEPNYQPVESNYATMILGGAAIALLALILARTTR